MTESEHCERLASRIRQAWLELPQPAEIWKGSSKIEPRDYDRFDFEERDALRLFQGKRFDEVDCEKFDEEALQLVDADVYVYYLGGLLLCVCISGAEGGGYWSIERAFGKLFRRRAEPPYGQARVLDEELKAALGARRLALVSQTFFLIALVKRYDELWKDELSLWGNLFFSTADAQPREEFEAARLRFAEQLRAQASQIPDDALTALRSSWELNYGAARDVVLAAAADTISKDLAPDEIIEALYYIFEWAEYEPLIAARPMGILFNDEQCDLLRLFRALWTFSADHYGLKLPEVLAKPSPGAET